MKRRTHQACGVFTAAIVAAAVLMPAPARAGQHEWATAGKILTGVLLGGLIADTVCHASCGVAADVRVGIPCPPPVSVVYAPHAGWGVSVGYSVPAPVVIQRVAVPRPLVVAVPPPPPRPFVIMAPAPYQVSVPVLLPPPPLVRLAVPVPVPGPRGMTGRHGYGWR